MANLSMVLRQYLTNKMEIVGQEQHFIFGEFSWPKNMKTDFLIFGSDKDSAKRQHYNLECLLFFFKHAQLKHSEYVRQAAAKGIDIVRRPDRKQLLAYLNEEVHDKSVLFKIPAPLKRAATDDSASGWTKKPRLEESYIQKLNQQVAALHGPNEKDVCKKDALSLSDIMTLDKIAALKTKRLTKKRMSINNNFNIKITSKARALLDKDVEDTNDIISRERQQRTRNTILQSRTKEFSSIFQMLDNIKECEEKKQKMQQTPSNVAPGSVPVKPTQSMSYNRYKQEKFIPKITDTGDFDIVTTGTYRGVPLTSLEEQAVHPAYVQPLPATVHLTSRLGSLSLLSTPQHIAQNKRPSRTPIIIVPPKIKSSFITLDNAKDILQDLRYIPSEKNNRSIKCVNEILIHRQKSHGAVPYRVVDNPQKLSKEEWERVVAVFVMGPRWQFKDWPFNGNPVEIFSKICAFHIKFDEACLDANVAAWSVSIIELSKTRRHSDRAAIMKFWDVLDKHLTRTKSQLRF